MIDLQAMGPGCAVLFAALLGLAGPAMAQQPGATDNELHAAYCVGVLDEQIHTVRATPNGDPNTRQLREGDLLPKLELRKRFADYLLATGLVADTNRDAAGLGALVAQRRGGADAQQCFQFVLGRCQPAVACNVNTNKPNDPWNLAGPSAPELKCMGDYETQCRAKEAACGRVFRCSSADDLPF